MQQVLTSANQRNCLFWHCGHLPCSIHWHRSSTRSRMRRLAGFPQFGLLIPKMAVSRHISVQCTDCGPRRGFLKQAMRLYGDSQCADDIRPWTLLDKGKDGLHPIPQKKQHPRVPCFLSVFTDHTLAHPLNCRGGVVARLSA